MIVVKNLTALPLRRLLKYVMTKLTSHFGSTVWIKHVILIQCVKPYVVIIIFSYEFIINLSISLYILMQVCKWILLQGYRIYNLMLGQLDGFPSSCKREGPRQKKMGIIWMGQILYFMEIKLSACGGRDSTVHVLLTYY